jgi:hypothetical protein
LRSVSEKSLEHTFSFQQILSEICAIYEITRMWKKSVHKEDMYDNIIERTQRAAYTVDNKATDTHSEYAILTVCLYQQLHTNLKKVLHLYFGNELNSAVVT